MNVKERFNSIINDIESRIELRSGLSAAELADQVLEEAGERKNLLQVSAAFHFLTGQALIPYIEERQLTHACQAIREGNTVEYAIPYTGYMDPFIFAAEFERQFGFRPEHAADEKETPFAVSSGWDVCADREIEQPEDVFTAEQAEQLQQHRDFLSSVMDDLGFDMSDPVYGFDPAGDPSISAEEEEIEDEAVALRLEYGFSVKEEDSVKRIAEKKKMDLHSAYVMATHLLQQFRLQAKEADPALEDMLFVYSSYDLSVPQSVRLVQDMKANGIESASSEPAELISEVVSGKIPYGEARSIYDAYINNRVNTSFSAFLAKVQELGDISKAVEQFYDPESEQILNNFFEMMRINFEDMSYFEQSEAERALMEQEAKANGFRYDASDDFDLSSLDLPGLDDIDF